MSTDSVAYGNDKIATPEVGEQTRTSAQAMARDNQRGATTIARSGEPPSELHADPIFSSRQAPETGAHSATGDLPGLPGSTPHEFALHNDDSSVASGDAYKSGATGDTGASPWRSGALIPGDVDPGDINKNVSRDGITTGSVTGDGDKIGTIGSGGDRIGTIGSGGDKIGTIGSGGDKIGTIGSGGDKIGTIGSGGDKIGTIGSGGGDKTGTVTPGDGFDSLLSQLGSSTDQPNAPLPNETGPYTVAIDFTQSGSLSLVGDSTGSVLLSQAS